MKYLYRMKAGKSRRDLRVDVRKGSGEEIDRK